MFDKIANMLKVTQDFEYMDYQVKVLGLDMEKVLGVKEKDLRSIASIIQKDEEQLKIFMEDLPHKYYEEEKIHAFILKDIDNIDKAIEEIKKFLPYITDESIAMIPKPNVLKDDKERVLNEFRDCFTSDNKVISDYAISLLIATDNFADEAIELATKGNNEGNILGIYMGYALIKNYDGAIKYIEGNVLPLDNNLNAIDIALKSMRVNPEYKEYLNKLKEEKK